MKLKCGFQFLSSFSFIICIVCYKYTRRCQRNGIGHMKCALILYLHWIAYTHWTTGNRFDFIFKLNMFHLVHYNELYKPKSLQLKILQNRFFLSLSNFVFALISYNTWVKADFVLFFSLFSLFHCHSLFCCCFQLNHRHYGPDHITLRILKLIHLGFFSCYCICIQSILCLY